MIRSSLILLSILTACLKDETVSGQTQTADIWVLQTMSETPVKPRVTIEFQEAGRISGQAPCNRYFASQTAPLPWFKIKNIGATKMACPNLDLEARYFGYLEKMTLVEIKGDTLILQSERGDALVFKKLTAD